MLERLAEHEYYCFLDGFSRYFQILVAPEDQEKTTFNCPYGTMAYKRMPFGLCNAPTTFQHYMMAIFHELIEDSMEIFMNDFSISGSSFDHCLQNLEKMLKRYEETNLILNWKKCHFMASTEVFGPIQNHRLHQSLCLTVSLHKQDAKLWLIRWTLLLQEFDIKIRDKKGVENLAPDHHSRLENPNLGKLNKAEIKDLFSEEQLMTISDRDQIIRRCVAGSEATQMLQQCHSGPSGGHHGIDTTARKVFEAGKLKSRWYGPFAVSKDINNGAIKLYDKNGNEFIINKQRVKPYQNDMQIVDKDDDITLEDEGEVT
ncbi:reverse transcriptase domain-containing protein [Tanacetum coccineum]